MRRTLVFLAALAAFDPSSQTRADTPQPLPSPPPMHSRSLSLDTIITRIAFGSCYAPQLEQREIWRQIANKQPQVLLMMGDNVYQSEEKAEPELRELREAYAMLVAEQEFAAVRENTTVFATWDDHDYGLNDAGAELLVKRQSEQLFEHVWPVSTPDPRKARDGVYYSTIYGQPGQRVQLIMLDTRFFRGRFDDANATMLGDTQWLWLAEELRKPAELRLLVSSIPVLSEWAAGENWHRLPAQRQHLFDVIKESQAKGVVLLSGDTHFAAQQYSDKALSYPLHEFIASSLNFPYPDAVLKKTDWTDKARLGEPMFAANFGFLQIDWSVQQVHVEWIDQEGNSLRNVTLPFARSSSSK